MTNINLTLEPSSNGGNPYLYYPGHLLKGSVELSLQSTKTFRGFYVTVYGEARAHWTEQRTTSSGSGKNRRTTTHTVHFEGRDTFLNSKTYFFGQRGGPNLEIPPGIHRYDFACHLPDQLPASLDIIHGEIKYYVEAVVDIPWRFDKEIKINFFIERHDDLNLYPELKLAQRFEEYKTFCCLFCESGPLLMEATICCTGFAKGQKIPLKIKYSNKSDVEVTGTLLKLKRCYQFTSDTPHEKTKSSVEIVAQANTRGVKEDENVEFECSLEIPAILMNSNGRFCRVVKVEYFLEIAGLVDGCHSNPEIAFPITIGSVPITFSNPIPLAANGYSIPQNNSLNLPNQVPSLQPNFQPTAPVDLGAPENDLPPSFDEAIKMPMPEKSNYMQKPEQPLGWNISSNIEVPSAPVPEN